MQICSPRFRMIYFLIFSFLLQTCFTAEIKSKLLHRHMTKREIHQYFGVDDHDAVPEYRITHPYESDEVGQFVSNQFHGTRSRRNADITNDTSYYNVDAFDKTMRLKLTQNDEFMAPGLMAETRHADGTIKAVPVSKKEHFLGKLTSDPDSLVVVRKDKGGLTGMIRHKRDTMFIQPLPEHLAKHFRNKRHTQPHLIYKSTPVTKREANCETPVDDVDIRRLTKRDLLHMDTNEDEEGSNAPVTHKHLEVALVADELLAQRLGSEISNHLLVIGHILNGMFHDYSIGDIKITYVVTRLITSLTYAELNVSSGASNHEKLTAFLSWAGNINPSDDADPLHFDVASFVYQGFGGGLAIAGGLCSSNSVGNVNNYIGLQTSGIIAHETAHNMHIGHDSEYGCTNMANIMASTVPGGTGAHRWSDCSRERIQTFLRSPGSSCMDDLPGLSRPNLAPEYHIQLAGELVDADEQCQLQYSSVYSRCPQTISNCGSMWCTIGDNSCDSHNAPVMDGATCGASGRQWCIKGECVDNGSPIIHGEWSEWSDYGPCSQSCGGGVQHRKRTCTNPTPENGGDVCVGSSEGHWRTCSTEECPTANDSFRDLQCQDATSNPAARAYYNAEIPCRLRCLLGGYITSHGVVKDGTRCFKESEVNDVCIKGECRTVGCDHQLDSDKQFDRCSVCDGDGQSCIQIQSAYTKNHKKWGTGNADNITVLPVGTSNANFTMREANNNVIGIKDENGDYIINLPSSTKVVYTAGAKIIYENKGNVYQTKIYIVGRTTKVLIIVFVYISETPEGVDYSFCIPRPAGVEPNATTFEWKAGVWSACPAVCAGGFETRNVHCFRSDDQTPANSASCDSALKPINQQLCNTHPCEPEWHTSPWQGCSKTCGNGTQSRFIICRRKVNGTFFETLDDSTCDSNLKPQEATFKHCNEIHCPPEWFPLPWSECSKSCGSGKMTRDVLCVRTNELADRVTVSNELCRYAPKPDQHEICNDEVPCTAPEELKIGCFKAKSMPLTELMADLRSEIDWENTAAAARKCAQLAHDKGYKYFALGKKGLCFSGQLVTNTTYFAEKGVDSQNCPSGVGNKRHVFIYSLVTLPGLTSLGCYKDITSDRALPKLYASFRSQIDWTNLNTTILQCAHLAKANGYDYFGVQYYGECWSAVNAKDTYDKHGESDKCVSGVGMGRTNFVYHLDEDSAQSA